MTRRGEIATVLLTLAAFPAAIIAQQQRVPTGTLIASNMNDNTATMLDAASGRVLATLPTGEAPHEVAVSHDGRWAVVSNYGVRGKPGNTLTLIDIAACSVARTLDLHDRQRPHGVKFLPGDTLLAVTSEASQAILIVDARSGAVITARPTRGRGSHMIGLSAAGDRMVTGNIGDATLSLVSTHGADSATTIAVAAQPEGVALTPDGSTAWVGSNRDSLVLVVDLRRRQAVDTIRGFGLPYRIAIAPNGTLAVVTDPVKAQIRIFDAATRHQRSLIALTADSLVATAEVKGSPSPEGVVISNDSRWAFVTLQGRDRVATIDLERGTVTGLAPTGTWSDGVGYSPLVVSAARALPSAASAFPSDSAIREIITARVRDKRATGIVVGLLEADGRTRFFAAGDAGPGKLPLDENSVFEIGSVTKTFTATMLAELVQQGAVSLDDPVQKYLPASVHVPTHGGKPVTLGSLAEQNSGLPRMPSNFSPKDVGNPYADYSVQQMYDFLSGYTMTRDPGAEFEYSNLGVGLLGHALALRAGKPYEQLVTERILSPLGMSHTAITLTPWMREHLALGHDGMGKITSNWDLPTFAGAGAIRSTATDMLRYLDANVHPERGPLGRAMELARLPRAPGLPGARIGLNWMIHSWAGDTIVEHGGATGGYFAFAGFVPNKKIAVVVLANSAIEDIHDIGMHLLEPEMPLATKPKPLPTHTAITLPVSALGEFVGVYQISPVFAITIRVHDGALFGQATGQGEFPLTPESATSFFVRDYDLAIDFVRGADGKIESLVLKQGGVRTTARRAPPL